MTPPPLDPRSFVTPIPSMASPGLSWLYVTGEDALCCTVFNAAAGVTVTITGRMLEFGQTRPTPFTQTIVPATDRSASVVRFSIGDGWLLNAQAIVSAGTPATGQTFARLSLVRGTTSNAIDLFSLAAGYVTAKMPLSYPGSNVLASVEGAGALRSIAGATPAAGAEISETVPTGARWQLLSFRTLFTTSATVATRVPALLVDDGANSLFVVVAGTQTASQGFPYAWVTGFGAVDAVAPGLGTAAGLPTPHYLQAGARIRSTTSQLQATDQYNQIQYLVREWIEGA